MRLPLTLRLFLAFACLSGAVLLAFAGWQLRSFRNGFRGYLDALFLQRLAPAGARLAAAYSEHGDSWDFLRDDPRRFGELIESAAGRFPHDEARHPRPPDRGPPPPFERGPRSPPENGGPPRHGPPDLMLRLSLLDADGRYVSGNPHVADDAAAVPILRGEQTVGTLRLAPLPRVSEADDIAFEQAQQRSAMIAALAVLVGALVFAFALARWLLAPVRALAAGTRALAAGDYARRIPAERRDELGALSRSFNQLAATLEQARDARRQWGADIAHELRTPLAVLRGEIQALQDGIRAPTAQALDSLHAECERLAHLIEDLYQLALADSGALDYRFEPLDLAELVRDAVELQRPACADAGLLLEQHLADALYVNGDARRLGQLIDNLLTNARRYTDAPGRIRVVLTRLGAQARLVVEDTAPGVPAAALPHLFDRLFRVEHSRTRAHGGAGLGLAICRAIVEAHGGRIVAQPSPLGGLGVVVELPMDADA